MGIPPVVKMTLWSRKAHRVFDITFPDSRVSSHSTRPACPAPLEFAQPIQDKESDMVTIFFAFVTLAFFGTIVGLMAEAVHRAGAFA